MYYMSADFGGRHVVGFWDLRVDVFLEVQNKIYSWVWYLINYIVYGPLNTVLLTHLDPPSIIMTCR